MAIYFTTNDPTGLLAKFKAAIRQEEEKGKITTWELDSDGDVTHKASQWARALWLRPSVSSGVLTFNTLAPKGKTISTVAYGYYHGHLIETFLNHFDKLFSEGRATAQATTRDNITG